MRHVILDRSLVSGRKRIYANGECDDENNCSITLANLAWRKANYSKPQMIQAARDCACRLKKSKEKHCFSLLLRLNGPEQLATKGGEID
jgi:hypothetical protein